MIPVRRNTLNSYIINNKLTCVIGAKNAAIFIWSGPVHIAWGMTSPINKTNVTEITIAANSGTILSYFNYCNT